MHYIIALLHIFRSRGVIVRRTEWRKYKRRSSANRNEIKCALADEIHVCAGLDFPPEQFFNLPGRLSITSSRRNKTEEAEISTVCVFRNTTMVQAWLAPSLDCQKESRREMNELEETDGRKKGRKEGEEGPEIRSSQRRKFNLSRARRPSSLRQRYRASHNPGDFIDVHFVVFLFRHLSSLTA